MLLNKLLTAIRDRRPASRSAAQRQEAQLEGQTVTNRTWQTLATPEGPVQTRLATTGPVEETVAPFGDEALAEVRDHAAIALRFVHDHVSRFDAPNWSLQDLDDAFANWTTNGDKSNCPPDAVEAIVGSAFGDFCVRTLDMRWVMITDAHGTAAAVEWAGASADYQSLRVFPFAAVRKRIDACEARFLVSIYRVLQESQRA